MGVIHRAALGTREFFKAEDLTLRQVIRRSRMAFLIFVLGLAGIVQWWSSSLNAQHARDIKTNRSLRATNTKLLDDERIARALASRVEHQNAKNAHALAVIAFEACTDRNDQRDRLVWILASVGIVSDLKVEQCPPKPMRLLPSTSPTPTGTVARPRTTTPRSTVTTTTTVRTTPQDTRPHRGRHPKDQGA